jgi:hypothetical protein
MPKGSFTMRARTIALYVLYFAPIAFCTVMLIRSVFIGSHVSEHALPETFACETVVKQLEAELWILYDTGARAIDTPQATKREPLPGRWRNWEATRHAAEVQCPGSEKKTSALLDLRRALENNLFLLSYEAGHALAEIHK